MKQVFVFFLILMPAISWAQIGYGTTVVFAANPGIMEVLVWSVEGGKIRMSDDSYKSKVIDRSSWSIKDTIMASDIDIIPNHVFSRMFGFQDSAETFFNRDFMTSDETWRKIMSDPRYKVNSRQSC